MMTNCNVPGSLGTQSTLPFLHTLENKEHPISSAGKHLPFLYNYLRIITTNVKCCMLCPKQTEQKLIIRSI